VDGPAGTVQWTPPPVATDGVTTSVLGRYTEDSVALVRGPLPGLDPAARQALRQQGTVTVAGRTLADLLWPPPPGFAAGLLRGEIAGVQGQTLTFFGGTTVTVPPATRVQEPGNPDATLASLPLGAFVQILQPPAELRGGPGDAAAPPVLVQVLPAPRVVDTVFTTGSAVGEPVVWQAQAATAQPSVLTGDAVTVTAQDSYGNPATTGSFTVGGQASPSLSPSFSAPPGAIANGSGQTLVTDHKAQAVALTVNTSGPYSQDDQALSLGTVRFQPGPPAAMTLQAGTPLTAGSQEAVSGTVTDVYGNPVLPSALDVSASAGSVQTPVTTQAGTGAYQTLFTAPTTLTSAPGTGEPVTLSGHSEQGTASAQAAVTVNPGPVARLTLQAPSTVRAGQAVSITGTAQDAYGNAVLNGTTVDLAASAGSLPASVATQAGRFEATFQAPSQPGSVTITAEANGQTASATVTVAAPLTVTATPTLPAVASGTTLAAGWSTAGPVYVYAAGTAGGPAANGGWLNPYGGTVTFQFTVPAGQTTTLAYGIPVGGWANNAPVALSVNGGTPVSITADQGPPGTALPDGALFWTQTFGPGTYTLTWSSPTGGSFNVYGVWASNPSAVVPQSSAGTSDVVPQGSGPAGITGVTFSDPTPGGGGTLTITGWGFGATPPTSELADYAPGSNYTWGWWHNIELFEPAITLQYDGVTLGDGSGEASWFWWNNGGVEDGWFSPSSIGGSADGFSLVSWSPTRIVLDYPGVYSDACSYFGLVQLETSCWPTATGAAPPLSGGSLTVTVWPPPTWSAPPAVSATVPVPVGFSPGAGD